MPNQIFSKRTPRPPVYNNDLDRLYMLKETKFPIIKSHICMDLRMISSGFDKFYTRMERYGLMKYDGRYYELTPKGRSVVNMIND